MEGVRAVAGGEERPYEMVYCAFSGQYGGALGDILYFLFQQEEK